MFVPITSEVTLGTGTILKEIATDRLFEIGSRLKNNPEVHADDRWELKQVTQTPREEVALQAVAYVELTEKYLAEVEE